MYEVCRFDKADGGTGTWEFHILCYLLFPIYFMEKMKEGVRFSGWSDEYGFVNEENPGVQTVTGLLIKLLLGFLRCVFPGLPVHHLHPLAAQYTLLDSDKWGRRKPVFPGTLFLVGKCV